MSVMESEQFFLKWNNFESNLASGFADLLQTEAMVDVTLAAEGKIVQAHKIILSVCSSYFRNMFQVNPCQHPIVVLKDVRYQELTDMLDFMYKGEANVRQQDLPSFLKLAQTLEVKGLAGSQEEEIDGSSRKRTQSKLSNLAKDFTIDLDEASNDTDKESVYKKKAKRCISPMLDSRSLPHSPNVKQEIEKCDNFLRNDMNMSGQNVIIKEERLSDNSLDSYGENLGSESTEVKRVAGPSCTEENCDTMPQGERQCREFLPAAETAWCCLVNLMTSNGEEVLFLEKVFFQTSDYSFLESCFGGQLLVLNGYSYRKKSATAERSYWFCCRRKCSAKGILHADGKFQLSNCEHGHEPEFEGIKKKERLVELKKLALQLNVSGQDLLEILNIKEDVKKYLSFIRTCRRRAKKRSPPEAPFNAGLNYERLASRVGSKEMILHSGYLYRQDSKNTPKEDCRYWRCRTKTCKARAKTDESGNLTVLKIHHYHPPEAIESSEPLREPASVLNKTGKNKAEKSGSSMGLLEKMKAADNETEEKLRPTIEAANDLGFSPSGPDTETFSFDKLMAETLADCVTPEFTDSLLKS